MICDKFVEHGMLKNSDSKYLYRGLRREEVDVGFRFVAKGIQTFKGLKLIIAKPSGAFGFENLRPIMAVLGHIKG